MLDSKYIYFKMSVNNALDCYIRKFGSDWKECEVWTLHDEGWVLLGRGSDFLYFRRER